MPTYLACGVTAGLSICDLQPTLSKFTDLRMGGEQRKDAARIQKMLSGGDKLSERVIGADGSERGVVQFIGAHEDMPLCMVEASKKLGKKHFTDQKQIQTEQTVSSLTRSSSDSPLTSLGATPTPTHEGFQDRVYVAPKIRTNPQGRSKQQATSKSVGASQQSEPSTEYHTLEQALQGADSLYALAAQALVLDIQVGSESFLPTRGGSASLGKDLKIEVFVNGELADVSFVNARRSAAQIIGDKIRFAGTRVHRQTEKPWIYSPEDVRSPNKDAEQRWFAISRLLENQARQRGTDRYGDLPPSAEFLGALAAVQLPDRLKGASSIGVVDVIITAGKGQKYGPDTAYLTCPTRMEDQDYTTSNPAFDPILLPRKESAPNFDGGAVASPLQTMSLEPSRPPESSPDVPLRSRLRQPNAAPASPSPTKKTMSLAREFGIDISERQSRALTVGSFENARGKPGPEGRTLLQRLGDLKKMNEDNKARELQRLKEDLSDVLDIAIDHQKADRDDRPAKRLRASSDARYVDPSSMMIDPQLLAINETMQEDDVFGADTITNPAAILTQNRIDMALDSGAASNSALLRRIASTSPVKTPRKTKASALAYSPTRTAIKEQRRGRPNTSQQGTPQKSLLNATPSFDDTAHTFLKTPRPHNNATNASPTKSRSGRGANRTASKWLPQEQTFAEALEAFGVPELCEGSCVTFPMDNQVSRQIGKARGGMFKEEGVVVGMRFVVW